MDLKEFQKQFDELMKENKKLQHLKERSEEYGKEVNEIAQVLKELHQRLEQLSVKINPVFSMKTRTYNKNPEVKKAFTEMMEKLNSGVQITADLISNTYPEMEQHNIYNVIQKIKRAPGVDSTKDGVKLRLFRRIG